MNKNLLIYSLLALFIFLTNVFIIYSFLHFFQNEERLTLISFIYILIVLVLISFSVISFTKFSRIRYLKHFVLLNLFFEFLLFIFFLIKIIFEVWNFFINS